MRRMIIVAAVLLAGVSAYAGEGPGWTERCTDRNFLFGEERGHVEEQTIDAGVLPLFRASVTNAPLSVRGGNGAGYTVVVCKAAARVEDLAAIQVSAVGGELRTSGPDGRRWSVTYRIETPRNANLELETKNGPVSLRDVDGRVSVRAANGPLSLKNVSGEIDASASNGPISVTGGSGRMKVETRNGPLSIRLAGASWQGAGLDASTTNGPVTLRMPDGYASGVVVEASGSGPMSCRVPGCERSENLLRPDHVRRSAEPRRIELGSGAAAVRISSVNGPVTIREE